LRQAALKFPDPKYRQWEKSLPTLAPASRSNILHPKETEQVETNE